MNGIDALPSPEAPIKNPDISVFERFIEWAEITQKPLYLLKLKGQQKDPVIYLDDKKILLPDKSLNPRYHLSTDEAVSSLENGFNVGIYGTTDGFCFLDIDLENGKFVIPEEKIHELIQTLDTFTVRTRSGGYQLFFITDGETGNPHIFFEKQDAGEFRRDWQYVVCPGCYVPRDAGKKGYTKDATGYYEIINDVPIKRFDRRALPEWLKFEKNTPKSHQNTEILPAGCELEDDQILDIAFNAKNGNRVQRLYNGNTVGYNSQSEADEALCFMLAFYTKDFNQILRLLRSSKLWDEKWEREDYQRSTIGKALQSVKENYGQETGTITASEEQDYKPFARWKLNNKTGEREITGIDRQKAIAYFREKYHPVSYRGEIWLYQDGIYSPEKGRINRDLTEISIGLEIQAQRSTYLEVVQMLRGVNLHEDDPFNRQEGIIPTLSGVIKLDFQNGTISGPFEHSHEYLFAYVLPVLYDPSVDTQKLMDVFASWVDADDIKYLIQLPALALIQSWGYNFKQAYLFEGPKNAGKTTYFYLIDGVVGEENRSTITLQNLVFNRFAAAGLVGKIMNIVDELPSVTLSNLDSFKNMIGGHAVWVEKKGQDGYSAHLRAVHCFNTNRPPACKISDDDAWWDRWVYVRFPNVFPSDPKWKTGFLTDETKSAFFNLILDKILEIMRDGGKAARMDPEDVKQIWMASADILMKFLEEETIRDPEGEIPKEEFYSKLVGYCRDRGKATPTKTAATIMLGRDGIVCSRPKVGSKQVRAYRGIIWKPLEKQIDINLANPDTHHNEESPYPSLLTFSKHLRIIQNKESTISKCTKGLDKTRQTRMQDLPSLVMKYDLYEDTDVSQHTRFTKAGYKCMCRGCDQPAMWHGPDKIRPLPLCDEHYRELKAAKTTPPQE